MNLDWDQARQYVIILSAFAASFVILYTGKRILFRRLTKWSQAGRPFWYGAILDVIQKPLNLIVVSISLGVALQAAPERIRDSIAAQTSGKILLILSIFWLIDRALHAAIQMGGTNKLSETTKALFGTIARLMVVVLGILICLDTLGISITPILASLGIGSIAIALALQDTLSNFFSGVYVMVDKPIRVGDMVRLEDSTEGMVRKIGWRSTHIETAGTNTVVIPNTKLATSVLTNYDMPSSQVNVTISLGVAYDCDLEKVERVTLETAKELLSRTSGGVSDIAPTVRFLSFGDSSINFNLVVRVASYHDTGNVKHELIKAIHARYNKDNIEIPYPQRSVRVVQLPASHASTSSATSN